jgi:hypothetical protein
MRPPLGPVNNRAIGTPFYCFNPSQDEVADLRWVGLAGSDDSGRFVFVVDEALQDQVFPGGEGGEQGSSGEPPLSVQCR